MQGGLIDPETGGPNIDLIRPLLGSQEEAPPNEIDGALISSHWVATALEALGSLGEAMTWYHLGQYKWRAGKQFSTVREALPDFGRREAAHGNQLQAAVCAARVGQIERARELYAWAAENYMLTQEEINYFAKTRQYQPIWEWLPFRAYALACLERWEEALAVAEECQRFVEKDRRARTTGSYQSPLKILAVVLALARYKVHPSEETRRQAQEMLQPQAVASRSHGDHLDALFYLYNLRARYPELAHPQPEELPFSERVRQGADACREWMAQGGIILNGTPQGLKLLDEHLRTIYRTLDSEEKRKQALFLWGSYFGEVVRRELAGGQWNMRGDNMLKCSLDWDMGEVELHLWPFNRVKEYVTGENEKGLYALWQEAEQAYIEMVEEVN